MIDNYEALTLGRYMRVNAVLDSDADEIQKQVQIIAILNDKSTDEILVAPLAEYSRMAAQTAFLREPCKPTEITAAWRLGDLVPTADFRKINTAQYVDFQTFAKNFPASLPELLSVFLVPEGKAYNDGYDVADVLARVQDLSLADALGLAAFFFARCSESIADSLTSWAANLKRTKDPVMKAQIAEKMKEVRVLLQSAGIGLQM